MATYRGPYVPTEDLLGLSTEPAHRSCAPSRRCREFQSSDFWTQPEFQPIQPAQPFIDVPWMGVDPAQLMPSLRPAPAAYPAAAPEYVPPQAVFSAAPPPDPRFFTVSPPRRRPQTAPLVNYSPPPSQPDLIDFDTELQPPRPRYEAFDISPPRPRYEAFDISPPQRRYHAFDISPPPRRPREPRPTFEAFDISPPRPRRGAFIQPLPSVNAGENRGRGPRRRLFAGNEDEAREAADEVNRSSVVSVQQQPDGAMKMLVSTPTPTLPPQPRLPPKPAAFWVTLKPQPTVTMD